MEVVTRELLWKVIFAAHIAASRLQNELSQESMRKDSHELESAALLAAIVESSDDAIISKDLDGTIMSWNQGAERIFGYGAREVIGRPITILIPPDHLSEEPEILDRIRRGNRVDHYETVRRRKNASLVDVSLTISPIKDAGGRIIGASKIARDITEQRKAQEKLRQSEERFRVTLASIGDAVMATDQDGRVTFINKVAEQLTGWSMQEALGVPLDAMFKIFNETTRKPVANPVARVLREGVVVGLGNHTILIAKDGTERPIDDSAAPIRGDKGELIGAVLVFRDVTAQRQAELAAQKLAAVVENSQDAIYTTDLGGVITSWNNACVQIFGYTTREAIGQNITLLIPSDRRNEESQIVERLKKGEVVQHFETLRRNKDGREFPISLSVSQLKDSTSDHIIGISKIARDITQHKQLEEALAKAHAELEAYSRNLEAQVAERTASLQQTIAELEAFSFTVSHDLRSPLRAMQGFAHAVQTEYAGKLDSRGQEYLARISNSAIRMDKLILEVLNYNSVGRGELSLKPIELDKLVDEVMHSYPSIQTSRAEIAIKRPLPAVLANHAALVQCVSNLLDNAVKFVPPGTGAKVRVWADQCDSKVRLSIQDNGIGIPENAASKIFEPFQRAHPNAGYEGTGMGLAIVRKAVQRMGGTAGVQSADGKGSTFWIELPAAE
jgi:PAS domain S-box-containing protein